MKNWALLEATMSHIEAHPENWNQDNWIDANDCGTTFCFAGWAIKLGAPQMNVVEIEVDGITLTAFVDENKQQIYVSHFAADLLGLDSQEVDELFYFETHTPEELREVLEGWK